MSRWTMATRAVALVLGAVTVAALPVPALAGAQFSVLVSSMTHNQPVTGRLLVYIVDRSVPAVKDRAPATAPFYNNPQPIYGLDVVGLKPGEPIIVDDRALAFPRPPSELPPGRYFAQAVLEPVRTNSRWNRQPGTLSSEAVEFVFAQGSTPEVRLGLTEVVTAKPQPLVEGVQIVEVRSRLLSEFHGREVTLRAGVGLPLGFNPSRRYPAVYEIPGFSGDHQQAFGYAHGGPARPTDALQQNAFIIVLDPESSNGHHLFADSANNGPVGQALVSELIPALEAQFPLIAQPSARLLRGHSSGGWSCVWLAMNYPDTFGGCFASGPDPLDFRSFQRADIYADANLYTHPDGTEVASNTRNGKVLMTVRQENQWEEVKGPDNTSAEQWDSWQAVFGPRNERGHPAALFDPVTGAIARDVAERYRRFDIADLIRRDPARYAPIFARGIRIVVGDADEWNLHEGVRAVQKALAEAEAPMSADPASGGHIAIVPGLGHGSIFRAPEMQAIPGHMLDAFRLGGHAPKEGP
ncbi:MAG TPA: hypothetical protein DEB06_09140 [Phycisphaerales bacterium]|nr:hypothetical protein [Phycisphaerales bacterium]